MSEFRGIKATFSTWRPVMGRKVLQLIFEVPIEQQGEVLSMLGVPDDKWCAIALLNAPMETIPANLPLAGGYRKSPSPSRIGNDSKSSEPSQRGAEPGQQARPFRAAPGTILQSIEVEPTPSIAEKPTEPKPKRAFHELSPTAQAGVRCDEEEFEIFFDTTHDRQMKETLVEAVRRVCGVKSRSEFAHNLDAANRWHEIEANYQSWLTDLKYAEQRR